MSYPSNDYPIVNFYDTVEHVEYIAHKRHYVLHLSSEIKLIVSDTWIDDDVIVQNAYKKRLVDFLAFRPIVDTYAYLKEINERLKKVEDKLQERGRPKKEDS